MRDKISAGVAARLIGLRLFAICMFPDLVCACMYGRDSIIVGVIIFGIKGRTEFVGRYRTAAAGREGL